MRDRSEDCSSWADAIAGCALGDAQEPDLAAHLAACPRCENALQESRALAARIDDAILRGSAVEPPSHGPERVMARIQGRADPWEWWRWAAVGGAIAVVLLAIVMIGTHRPAPGMDVTALSTWRSPTGALLDPPVPAAWTTTPRLGAEFLKMKAFQIKRQGEIHEP